MSFVHLHRHSEFSLLDGLGTAEDYAKRAVELEQPALAITDHGSLAGTLYHYEACEKHGIKPILGMEAYFRQDISADRAAKRNQEYFHLVLLAKNLEGWRNLMRLSSAGFMEENFYQKPCIDWRLLRQHSEGLIASSSCVGGIIPQALVQDRVEANRLLSIFLDIFGEDFYLEIQPHDFELQKLVNIELVNIMQARGVPVVATQDVHYPYEDWADTQPVLFLTRTGAEKELDVPDTCWLTSEDETLQGFLNVHPNIPVEFIKEAIGNSGLFAERIEHIKIDKSPKIPKATRSEAEAESILLGWCEEGLERIGKTNDPVYIKRIQTELDVLKKLKVLDYFVIVGDMVRWAKSDEPLPSEKEKDSRAKKRPIRVGPGRGSAAGCLINYLIRITSVDPIGYGLLFERFMNEYRTELPDIDIDFQDDRRDEVKQYLREKWGEDHVIDIAAFQSFGLKAAIKDVARVLKVDFGEVNRATKTVPDKTWGMDLDDLAKTVPEIGNLFKKYPEVYKHATRLQGQIKGQSKHAAAVIVTDRPAFDLIPMMKSKDGGTVTQWSERANGQLISPYGFLKIDCLSTDSLTAQDRFAQYLRERRGIEIDFEDIKQFPVMESPNYAESDVVEAFANGACLGIFQFGKEDSGIKSFLKGIKPEHLEHIIAANAMYRPGPMALLGDYAARKNGAPFSLPHPKLEEYLGYTYGIMVYQEQVMQMYNALAKDATPADAATFLKVVSKGIARDLQGKQRLQAYYDKFAEGCEEKNIPKRAYDELWDQILQMSTYAFNKSHATGYAMQAYQDKWEQTRYPLEFYAALLTTESDNAKKLPRIIKEAKLFGINILPPDINTSESGFTIDGNSIRFGLLAIKFVADAAIGQILEHRPFESWEDFYERVPKSKVNKRVKKALVEAGAFDTLGGRREWILDEEGNKKDQSLTEAERTTLELDILGYALTTKSEIDKYRDLIRERTVPADELQDLDKQEVMLGGEISKVKEITTKKGDKMAFVDMSFETDDYSLTFFPEKYGKYQHILSPGTALLVLGDWDKNNETTIVRNAVTASQLAEDMKNVKS